MHSIGSDSRDVGLLSWYSEHMSERCCEWCHVRYTFVGLIVMHECRMSYAPAFHGKLGNKVGSYA